MTDPTLLKPPPEPRAPAKPAPAWVALAAAWTGLLAVAAGGVFLLLPGSADPRAELEGLAAYSWKDRFVPVPVYASVVGLFLGIVTLWQMRHTPAPRSEPMVLQRLQAWIGVFLSLAASALVYAYVHLYGPR